EETQRVIGERRLRLLREVAACSSETNTPDEVCAAAAACISTNARDLPFALLYLCGPDGKTARLVARAGMDAGRPGAEPVVDLDAAGSIWPLREAQRQNQLIVVENLPLRIADVPAGAWDRPPDRAAVAPLGEHGQSGVAGFLVAGLNPYLPFEEEHR